MMFPSFAEPGDSGFLRAVAVGRQLRHLGWRVTIVPPQLEWSRRQRLIRAERPDILFFQQSHHPLNRPRLYPDIPCVYDVDDANICDPPKRDESIECASESRAVVVGNHFLRSLYTEFNDNVHVVWTSVDPSLMTRFRSGRTREPSVVWAQLNATSWRHEAELVQEVVGKLSSRCKFKFTLMGEADRLAADRYLRPLRLSGVECVVLGTLQYQDYLAALTKSAVGLNPLTQAYYYSQGRSFGKLLGYMIAHVAIVTAPSPDYSEFFTHRVNAMVANEEDITAWVECCRELLEEQALRDRLAGNAFEDLGEQLSTRRAAREVDRVLRDVLGSKDPSLSGRAVLES
jgi:hypothetical protein